MIDINCCSIIIKKSYFISFCVHALCCETFSVWCLSSYAWWPEALRKSQPEAEVKRPSRRRFLDLQRSHLAASTLVMVDMEGPDCGARHHIFLWGNTPGFKECIWKKCHYDLNIVLPLSFPAFSALSLKSISTFFLLLGGKPALFTCVLLKPLRPKSCL